MYTKAPHGGEEWESKGQEGIISDGSISDEWMNSGSCAESIVDHSSYIESASHRSLFQRNDALKCTEWFG